MLSLYFMISVKDICVSSEAKVMSNRCPLRACVCDVNRIESKETSGQIIQFILSVQFPFFHV